MSMKQAYEKKLQAELDQWRAEIDRLKAIADKSHADAQLKYYQQVEELRGLEGDADRKLAELKESSGHAWEDLKAGTESAWKALGNAVQSAKDRFR